MDRNSDTGGEMYGAVRVALRKESVDRNSAPFGSFFRFFEVALRKESVDRNPVQPLRVCGHHGRRSPQGERG